MVVKIEEVGLKRNGQWILKNINWEIKKGENWILYGLNGAGKTALLNMICAYYHPTVGKMEVLGKEFGKSELGGALRRKIGLVSNRLQQNLYASDSAFEIVLSGAYASIGLYESPTTEIRNRAIEIMEKLGSLDYADRPYSSLSQGERQRVLIGRALMVNPELIILDEPATGLDFLAREQLLDTISSLVSENSSIIYVTHHVEEILPVFSHTFLLKKGGEFISGYTKEVLTSKNMSSFFSLPVEVIWNNERPLLARSSSLIKK
ncbi:MULTISPECIES: ABC transporter ATP-binding protein [Niallia]|jgi:iron complex transport system ATP-binding protein|uniref:ABC transporter ATP-binding protein n=1 Tax=Niallia TaxID=2837506 RepID=UPI0030FC50D5